MAGNGGTLLIDGLQPVTGTPPTNSASINITGYGAATNPGQIWMHADNSGFNFVMDNNFGSGHNGYFGFGYNPGTLIPYPLSVVGAIGSDSYMGPATAPSGSCPTNGAWVFSQDGHATFCAAGTWTTKI
jgi:hypothetical protein